MQSAGITSGVGKTHLAVALGLKAIEQHHGVYFMRAHDLLEDLCRAQAEHRLDRRMRVYLAPKVLVIDEFGVWPYDRLAATALFTLISARYERGSVILTSNKGFAEWGDVLGDSVIATAILDRLLSRYRDNSRYPEVRIIPRSRPTEIGGDLYVRDNQAPAKNRIRASGARYRPTLDERGVSLAKAFSFMDMSECR